MNQSYKYRAGQQLGSLESGLVSQLDGLEISQKSNQWDYGQRDKKQRQSRGADGKFEATTKDEEMYYSEVEQPRSRQNKKQKDFDLGTKNQKVKSKKKKNIGFGEEPES